MPFGVREMTIALFCWILSLTVLQHVWNRPDALDMFAASGVSSVVAVLLYVTDARASFVRLAAAKCAAAWRRWRTPASVSQEPARPAAQPVSLPAVACPLPGAPVRGDVYLGPPHKDGNCDVYCVECGRSGSGLEHGVLFDVRWHQCTRCGKPLWAPSGTIN